MQAAGVAGVIADRELELANLAGGWIRITNYTRHAMSAFIDVGFVCRHRGDLAAFTCV